MTIAGPVHCGDKEIPAKGREVTLRQLSERLGVSASTISRVLNGYEEGFSVKPEVRERILRAVLESGYRPNPFVRSLRSKRTMMVAWLDYKQGARGDSGVDEDALRSIVGALAAEGYAVSCNFLSEEEPDQYFPQWPVDGIAIADVVDPDRMTRITAAGIPYVVVNGLAGPGGNSVMVDEAQCSRLLFDYLHGQGHTRIAYFNKHTSGRTLRHYSVGERHAAYLEFMQDIGVMPLPGHDRNDMTASEFIRTVVSKGGATAVVAYDHLHVLNLMRTAYEMGVRVPSQVSVACFNDLFPLEYLSPPVTCVATPGAELGRVAAVLLLEQMKDHATKAGRTVRVPGTLTIRDSVVTATI